jgi:opacity protein-like surface antigen
MKKHSLLIIASSFFAQAALAAPFNGWYAGGQLGYTVRPIQTNFSSPFVYSKTKNNNGVFGGLHVGYGQVLASNMYFGGELAITTDSANKSQTHSTPGGAVTVKYSRGMVFSLAPRVGFLVDPTWLVYFKPGLEYSRDKADIGTASQKSTKYTFAPGGGFETFLSSNIIVGAEYKYTFPTKISKSQAGVNGSLQNKAHVFALRVSYQF